ncbi:hypothetical protein [Ralstonia solanacearum]|uniref:hypothetical protein n=1 Tax=Ralstonia solanacearum TaxID=305 RepID=UPI0012D356A5|nr:hypothetical protein [Ralstonia solanacearum]
MLSLLGMLATNRNSHGQNGRGWIRWAQREAKKGKGRYSVNENQIFNNLNIGPDDEMNILSY